MDHLSYINHDNIETEIQILHTPGHTPDELALWDGEEKMLYVGDTLYEWSPIIFPEQGDIIQWFASVDFLIDFVRRSEKEALTPVKINSGHCTSMGNALEVLVSAKTFLQDVVSGKENPILRDKEPYGFWVVYYQREDGRFSLRCPEKLVLEARKKMKFN